MLRRKPTRLELDQTDIDELDQIREATREKAEAQAIAKNPATAPIMEKTAREKATEGMSIRERLGLSGRMPNQ